LTDSAPASTQRGVVRCGADEEEGMTEARTWRRESAERRGEERRAELNETERSRPQACSVLPTAS